VGRQGDRDYAALLGGAGWPVVGILLAPERATFVRSSFGALV